MAQYMRHLKLLVVSAVLLTLTGCATMYTLQDKSIKSKVFSGTVEHVRLKCVELTCYDAPLSLAMDAVMFPFTLPYTVYAYGFKEEPEPPKKEEKATSRHLEWGIK